MCNAAAQFWASIIASDICDKTYLRNPLYFWHYILCDRTYDGLSLFGWNLRESLPFHLTRAYYKNSLEVLERTSIASAFTLVLRSLIQRHSRCTCETPVPDDLLNEMKMLESQLQACESLSSRELILVRPEMGVHVWIPTEEASASELLEQIDSCIAAAQRRQEDEPCQVLSRLVENLKPRMQKLYLTQAMIQEELWIQQPHLDQLLADNVDGPQLWPGPSR